MDFREHIRELTEILSGLESSLRPAWDGAVEAVCRSLRSGGKILAFGNGGSAAEAQHFVAELVNKFLRKRPAIRAISLTTDTSILTSVGNDLSFDRVFSRQIEALASEGDVALALSTSGTSPNIVRAVETARAMGLVTVALTGLGGGALAGAVDHLLAVPSANTPRIQEAHLFLLHRLALEAERRLFEI
ncbi:MAG: SIS domain-containing protein [Candidatus Aminicenantes bacterium]|nr:SIS domain-containing protein [Candidatus Aminicenantes bacterium]